MDYIVIKEDSASKLEKEVRKYIQNGYVPHGSMSVANDGCWFYPEMEYCQAMTKEKF